MAQFNVKRRLNFLKSIRGMHPKRIKEILLRNLPRSVWVSEKIQEAHGSLLQITILIILGLVKVTIW
jgi:hypothetical protein